MRNELQRHKRSDKVKWVLTGIMFFLAFVMIAGLILQVFGTGKAKPSEWFKRSYSEQTEQLPAEGSENATAHTRVRAMAATLSADKNGISAQSSGLPVGYRELEVGDDSSFFGRPAYIYFLGSGGQEEYCCTELFKIDDGEIFCLLCGDFYVNGSWDTYVGFYWKSKIPSGMLNTQLSSPSGINFGGVSKLNCWESDYDGYLWGFDGLLEEYGFDVDEVYSSVYVYDEAYVNVVPLPDDPEKEGHTFVGWYYDSAFTRPYDGQPIYTDTQLYAKFEINKFTVTFNSDGGSSVSSQTVNWNTAATLSTPTRSGYNFKGWFLADGTQYTNQPIKKDTTLTAHWEIQTFTVTFYVDGEVYVTKTVEYGQGLVKIAETANLKMLSVRMASGVPTTDENGAVIVTEDCAVEAQEMSNADKAINTVKNNKWAIIGGVAGGVALIAIIAAVCGGAKRKRRR